MVWVLEDVGVQGMMWVLVDASVVWVPVDVGVRVTGG
jgi:hypothetical protein